ncbi:MAG: L-lysine 6-transaminase [bacterium]|nr:L-lysine 6-transaminase [Candidatus Kapabacteria bacterium]
MTHTNVTPDVVHSTLSQHMLADGFDIVLDLDKSTGAYLYDAITGKRYLDFFTFFASNPVGMNHPKMRTDEFMKTLGRVALHKPSSSDLYTVEMATFVDAFFRIAVPSHFKYVFLIEGGAMAVENALKTAFDWKVRKNFAKGYDREVGHRVLHFKQAFHGRSGYTMSLTNTDPAKTDLFPKFDWPRVSNPGALFPLEGENLKRTIDAELESIAQIENAIATYPDDIACMILEPIQAEGGDNHFRPEFLRELRRICDQHEIMLIFDEVQTGVGLTGSMWAHQTLGVVPDIISFGKKTQVCGGVIERTVDRIGVPGAGLQAWLGPTIGPRVYEVGVEVRDAFLAHDASAASAFVATRPGHWLLDLYAVARQRLAGCGIASVSGGTHCTHTEQDLFFSFRRDKAMQRMAACIWRV